MGYQALLFCPDEKTARTVTQVLSELDFNVEACTEPFAAVKKLMGQHFDAVVVDCDNEQNATLLFKSARNSTSNQASLAVAIVEGQAGVAKAFRIGANLVLTKPINIEQSKGTLRVARGLLRKSEPSKGVTTVVAAAPTAPPTLGTPNKPTPNPISVAKPAPPVAAPPVVTTQPAEVPAPKPPQTQAWPAAASAGAAPVSSAKREADDDLLEIETKESDAKAPVAASSAPPPVVEAKPAFLASQKMTSGSGAASAPAPAREVAPAREKPAESVAANTPFEKPAEAGVGESTPIVGSAPSFSFGGANEAESSGGSKKIFIGIAAALVVAGGLYFGWTHFHGSADQSFPSAAVSSAPVTPAVPKPSGAQPAKNPAITSPTSQLSANPATSDVPKTSDVGSAVNSVTPTESAKPSAPAPSVASKAAPTEDKPAEAPLVVKGGSVPSAPVKATTPDAPAPSMIGLAAPGTAAPPPNLVTSNDGLKPLLQSVNVSQGVSQGLLIKKVPPSYPANALRMRVEGTVELQATISKSGDITHVKVISGDAQLTRSASDAVKQWKYKPYLLNGEPVEIQTQITINFKLPQ